MRSAGGYPMMLVLVATLVAPDHQTLQSANAERPAICVAAQESSGSLTSVESRDLGDSVNDLRRALQVLDRRHRFDVAAVDGACSIRLVITRRIEDEEEETATVIVRLMATALAGDVHDEEVRATAGTWRGAASSIARKVAFFVDSNRASLGGPLPDQGREPATRSAAVVAPAARPTAAAEPEPPAQPAADARPETAKPITRPAASSSNGRVIEDRFLDWVRLRDESGRPLQTPVYLQLFATDHANLGTGGEGGKETRTVEARTLLGQGPTLLQESFVSTGNTPGLKAHTLEGTARTDLPEDALIIEGAFVRIDPGSRAKRYWVGFGAGKSSIEIAGRVVNPAGEILAEFRHRRIGVIGIGGGDSLGKLLSDTRSSGEDIAKFVHAWLTGKLSR